jgi:hypothetical protein
MPEGGIQLVDKVGKRVRGSPARECWTAECHSTPGLGKRVVDRVGRRAAPLGQQHHSCAQAPADGTAAVLAVGAG